MRPEHKSIVRSEVTARIVERFCNGAEPLADLLGDTVYYERLRLEKERYRGEEKDIPFWNAAARTVATAGTSQHAALLKTIVQRFVDEIMGHFDPRLYQMATRFLPTGLGALLTSLDPRLALRAAPGTAGVRNHVVIQGEVEAVRKLANQGTLVVCPTHLSNLDSLVLGYAAYLMGLPPLLYGAGLNLFTNKFLGAFMRNLGAYRVDRRKKSAIYKEVLKEYATFSIELGYHNLFFPGGTRIRSGEVERRLKKGLLGTGLQAYINNVESGRPRPNVYVIPCSLSYGLVLEAQTLIEDHLKEVGRSRYIILDDEFSRPRRIAQFLNELIRLDSKIYITFGQPLDPFGNPVDFHGTSRDACGREIDIRRYVCQDNKVVADSQRDREYTRELEASLVKAYEKDNRIQSTHIAAFVAFRRLRDARPDADLYRLLREGTNLVALTLSDVIEGIDCLLHRVRTWRDAGQIRLAPELVEKDAAGVLEHALGHFRAYHRKRPLRRKGVRLFIDAPLLTLYYHNRLTGYGLESVLKEASCWNG